MIYDARRARIAIYSISERDGRARARLVALLAHNRNSIFQYFIFGIYRQVDRKTELVLSVRMNAAIHFFYFKIPTREWSIYGFLTASCN